MAKKELSHEQKFIRAVGKLGRFYGVRLSDEGLGAIASYSSAESVCNPYLDSRPTLQDKIRAGQDALEFLGDSTLPIGWAMCMFPHEVATALISLRSVTDDLPAQRQQDFLAGLRNVVGTSIMVHTEPDCRRAIRLARQEADQVMKLMMVLLPEEETKQRGFRAFSRRLTRLAQADNLLDTFFDFGSDIRCGKLSCAPTVRNKLRFGIAGASAIAVDVVKTIGDSYAKEWGLLK